jgi:S1-C subfamily serine protease
MPLLSLDGNGPPAERTYTGTAFAIADGTVLATNRHVAEPWNSDGSAGVAATQLEPFMIKIIAYSPDLATERPLELIKSSDDADLALLRFTTSENPLAPLRLARAPVTQGEAVIVMGYPTGLRSMLARAGKGFVEDLQRQNQTDFWQVARFLSAKGFIKPLSSSGIVAQSTFEFLVYDAATTHGGSGGPVLSSSGEVVAINAAILPDYSGSNFGVPVQKLLELIAETDIKLVTKQVEN